MKSYQKVISVLMVKAFMVVDVYGLAAPSVFKGAGKLDGVIDRAYQQQAQAEMKRYAESSYKEFDSDNGRVRIYEHPQLGQVAFELNEDYQPIAYTEEIQWPGMASESMVQVSPVEYRAKWGLKGEVVLQRKGALKGGMMKAFRSKEYNLRDASATGNLAEVQRLVNKGANVNATNKEGKTALQLALENEHKEVYQFLAKVQRVNKSELNSLLLQAAEMGRIREVNNG